jgi:hypothetical protein
MPDQDAVVALTAETGDMQAELNLVWKYLLPAMYPGTLPANTAALMVLQQHIAALNLPPLYNKNTAGFNITGKKFSVQPNNLHIKNIAFSITGDTYHVILQTDSATYPLAFETGKWLLGETDMQVPGSLYTAKEDFSFLKPNKVAGSYCWTDGQTLQLRLRYIESPHTEIITCHFNDDKLTADVGYSLDFGKKKIELTGVPEK